MYTSVCDLREPGPGQVQVPVGQVPEGQGSVGQGSVGQGPVGQGWVVCIQQFQPHSHIRRAGNLAFAGASNYRRGLLSFKHSSVDGQSAHLTDLCNGEQVNKYRITKPFTATALLSHVMWSFCLHLTMWVG